jgi:hypothetical protein
VRVESHHRPIKNRNDFGELAGIFSQRHENLLGRGFVAIDRTPTEFPPRCQPLFDQRLPKILGDCRPKVSRREKGAPETLTTRLAAGRIAATTTQGNKNWKDTSPPGHAPEKEAISS